MTLPSGEVAYTRAGNFGLNAVGGVVTARGYVVSPHITIPPQAVSMSVGNDGTVTVQNVGAYVPDATATHMHVLATELQRGKGQQLTLFEEPDPRREAIAAAKEAINTRFGRFKVRSGSTLYLPAVYRDPANSFDICDVRGKICF